MSDFRTLGIQRSGLLFVSLSTLLVLAAVPGGANAQQTSTPETETETETETDDSLDVGKEETQTEPVERSEKQGACVGACAEQAAEIASLKKEVDNLRLEMNERTDALENQLYQALESPQDDQSGTIVSGFFDLSFHKFFLKKDSGMSGLINNASTFTTEQLAVYFSHWLSPQLFALAEIHFTFAPHGYETDLINYERVDTNVTTGTSLYEQTLGGIVIERVQLDWQPLEAFGVRIGRFLTPFGIWNENHGSPVVITVHRPYMIDRRIMPLSQTGLQLFGRLFFGPSQLSLEYAVTLTNGRGPMDAVFDLDENKGVGTKLKATYQTKDIRVALGGYGYYGKYTDVKKQLVSFDPFRVDVEETASYEEWIGSLDLLVDFRWLHFQAEYIRKLTLHQIHPRRIVTRGPGDQPDYVATGTYGLLGIDIPIETRFGAMNLMPYVEVEYVNLDDSLPSFGGMHYLGGINVKPSPFVTVKAEYHIIDSNHGGREYDFSTFSAQAAVSF